MSSATLLKFCIRCRHARGLPVILASVWFLALPGLLAAQFQINAKLEPDSTVVGGTVVYVVTVQTTTGGTIPAPKLPEFDPAWGLSTPSQVGTFQSNSSISIGPNGSTMTRIVIFRYAFTGSKEGTFNFGPTTLQAGTQVFQSNPVTLKVTKMPAAANVPSELQNLVAPPRIDSDPALAQKLTGAVFVLPVVNNPNPFNGEQTRVAFHLCIDAQAINSAGLTGDMQVVDIKPPAMKEFIREDIYQLSQKISFLEQVIGGRTYQVAPLADIAISSTKTGKVEIDPYQVNVLFGRARRSRGGPFDDDLFGSNPFFSGMDPAFLGASNRVEVIAQSRPVEINVKPLPTDGKPAGFSGAVGDFKISAALDRDKAKANEDVLKLTLTIDGKGDATAVKPPPLGNLANFTQLGEAKATTQSRKENDEYLTTRKIDFMLRPTQPGKLEIPPISFSVFNPKSQLYESLESNPVLVDVAPGTQPQNVMQAPVATAPGAASAPGNNPAAATETDLRYIHSDRFTIIEPGVLSGEGSLFYAALALPPAMMLAGYLFGRRKQADGSETRSRRRKRAGELARKHLRQAEKLLNSPDRKEFFAELARGLRTYFGNRFGIESAGLTIEQIVGELEAAAVPPEAIERAVALLEQCDAAQYSPAQPEPEVARQAYNNAGDMLNQVERKE